ncbi:MAG: hypothetical protein OEL20_05055 [Sulfuritalea sp.]|nr:hypothetical protein [Sulfuritalea sp.]
MHIQVGILALRMDVLLPLQVIQSAGGFYIGTASPTDGPLTRESREQWRTREQAIEAFESGDWTQRHAP